MTHCSALEVKQNSHTHKSFFATWATISYLRTIQEDRAHFWGPVSEVSAGIVAPPPYLVGSHVCSVMRD